MHVNVTIQAVLSTAYRFGAFKCLVSTSFEQSAFSSADPKMHRYRLFKTFCPLLEIVLTVTVLEIKISYYITHKNIIMGFTRSV